MKLYHLFFLSLLLAVAVWAEDGCLTVTTEPSGAKVYYSTPGDEELKVLGQTPINYVQFPEGIYRFVITLEDHDTVDIEETAVFPGRHKKIFRELSGSYAYLEVESKPDSSVLFLDMRGLALSASWRCSRCTIKLVLPLLGGS